MGCDIHYVVEKKLATKDGGSRWVGWVHDTCWNNYRHTEDGIINYERVCSRAGSRNYQFFGALANVRSDGPSPLGLPEDISDMAQYQSDHWGVDGHSHSYCSAQEFLEKLAASQHNSAEIFLLPEHPATKDPYGYFLNMDAPEDNEEYRVVFWFDN